MNKPLTSAAIVSLFTALINTAALAQTEKTASPPKKKGMVYCLSQTCAGKFEYNGQQNSCDQKSDAMLVPKKICDPKKGLKIVKK